MPSAAEGVIDRSVGHSAFRKLPTPERGWGSIEDDIDGQTKNRYR